MAETSGGKRKSGPRARIERSAGGVVLRRIDDRVHILLIRDPYQNLGLPKGHLEKGESASDAALREVNEETGLESLDLGPELATIDWYFRLKGRLIHKFCSFFVMHSPDGDVIPELAEGITECLWVPMEEAVDRIAYDNAREVVEVALELLRSEEGLPWEF